jgi:type IV secretion system protein VirB1
MMELESAAPPISFNSFLAPVAKRSLTEKAAPKKRLPRLMLGLGTGAIYATFSLTVLASPLSKASFNQLASSCAPGVEIPTLRAVAAVESHFDPLAVRDNTTHESWTPFSLSAAAALTRDRLKLGHSVDIGLMQINSGNLASLGIGVEDALDACHSLDAAHRILQNAFAAGSSEAERQAAILITLSRYNTGKSLAGVANGYANQVISSQSAPLTGNFALQKAPNTPPQWDIWGTSGAEPTSWVVTADGSSEIERAGAQTSDARDEGRVPASPSEKGEPYELSAYQESEPSKP